VASQRAVRLLSRLHNPHPPTISERVTVSGGTSPRMTATASPTMRCTSGGCEPRVLTESTAKSRACRRTVPAQNTRSTFRHRSSAGPRKPFP
jgi:hypothetical protein